MHPYRLPDYDLLRVLHVGSAASHFIGRHRSGDFFCVIKLLTSDHPADVRQLREQAQVGLAVRHPHLVRTLDARVHAAPYYVVMEHLTGVSAVRIQCDFQTIGTQLAGAIRALHRASFAHGAISPEHVWIDRDGDARLIGLGHAGRARAESGLTFDSDWQAFRKMMTVQCLAATFRMPQGLAA